VFDVRFNSFLVVTDGEDGKKERVNRETSRRSGGRKIQKYNLTTATTAAATTTIN